MRRALVGTLVALGSVGSVGAAEYAGPPRLLGAAFNQRPAGTPERYEVVMSAGVRVKAVPGPLKLSIRERLEVGGKVFGERTKTYTLTQTTPEQRHEVSWKLEDQFFGVGWYRLRATVTDARGRTSNVKTRGFYTED